MIRVMFMQSQSFLGADSELHAQLMRYMDRSQVELSIALTRETNSMGVSARRYFEAIPNIHIRLTDFGASWSGSGGFAHKLALMPRMAREMLKLASFCRENGVQIIHCTEKPRDAFYGVLLAKMTGARCVVHVHVNYGEWLSPTVKWALKHADALVSVSKYAAHSISEAGYRPDRIHVVLNALDLSSERWNDTTDKESTRKALGIPDDAVVLGIVSRLFLYKGHRDLFQALALVKAHMPSYRLVIVGEDDPRSHPGGGRFSAELKAYALELGMSDNIIFTGFRTDIPQLMESFDLYTMPSWEEPFGMVFLEAMALGKPVVAWKLAGPEEIVINGETGFLVQPKAHQELGEAILTLARDAEMRQRFGQAGRRRVEERFSSQRMCADVLALYRQLAEPSSALQPIRDS
jgi:glycosyltransferase involved in cell wall biosynthesis